jgi:hypothetical protein
MSGADLSQASAIARELLLALAQLTLPDTSRLEKLLKLIGILGVGRHGNGCDRTQQNDGTHQTSADRTLRHRNLLTLVKGASVQRFL